MMRCLIFVLASLRVVSAGRTDIKKISEAMQEDETSEAESHNEEGTMSGSCCTCKVGSGLTEGFKCLSAPGPTTRCYEAWVSNASSAQYAIYKKTGMGSICKGSMMIGNQKWSCWSRDDSVKSGQDDRPMREQCKSMVMTFPPKRGALVEVSAHEAAKRQDEALKESAAAKDKTHSEEENSKAGLQAETKNEEDTAGDEGTMSGSCCTCKVGSGLTEGFKCLNAPGPTKSCYEPWVTNSSSMQYGIYQKTGIGSICKGSMMKGSQKYACWSRDDSVKSGQDNRSFREQCKSMLMSFPPKKGSLAEVSAHEDAKVQDAALK